MQIFVKTQGGTFTLDVDQTATVEQLKASIEEREWIPAGLQRLVCGATPLTTGLLSEMGVGEEDTISLLMDIRGGMRAKWRKKRMRRLRRKRRKMRMRAR